MQNKCKYYLNIKDIADDFNVDVNEINNWFKNGCISKPSISWTNESIIINTVIQIDNEYNKILSKTFTFPILREEFYDWIDNAEKNAEESFRCEDEYICYEDEEDFEECYEDEEDDNM